MITTIDTAAVEVLRSFAVEHGEVQFAHLCTAALAGEQWAIDRLAPVVREVATLHPNDTTDRLHIIERTDTSRPDGAIAKSIKPPM